jgi:hypothetical protein
MPKKSSKRRVFRPFSSKVDTDTARLKMIALRLLVKITHIPSHTICSPTLQSINLSLRIVDTNKWSI